MLKPKIYAINKQATIKYHIHETLIAGMILSGSEVKAIRAGNVDIRTAYVQWAPTPQVNQMHISLSNQALLLTPKYNPKAPRGLLLHQHEINHSLLLTKKKHWTCIPLKIFSDKKYIKIELGLVSGLAKQDKRAQLKAKSIQRRLHHREYEE